MTRREVPRMAIPEEQLVEMGLSRERGSGRPQERLASSGDLGEIVCLHLRASCLEAG